MQAIAPIDESPAPKIHALYHTFTIPHGRTIPFRFRTLLCPIEHALEGLHILSRKGCEFKCNEIRFSVLRPHDMMVIDIELQHFDVKRAAGRIWARKRKSTDDQPVEGIIILHFPPQHILEQSCYIPNEEECAVPNPASLPFDKVIGEVSRLAFTVDATDRYLESQGVLLDPEAILELCRRLSPRVVDAALPPLKNINHPGALQPSRPEPHETSLHFPNGMELSPHENERWQHAIEPVVRNLLKGWDGPQADDSEERKCVIDEVENGQEKRYELWHTHLVAPIDLNPAVTVIPCPGDDEEKAFKVHYPAGTPTLRGVAYRQYDTIQGPCDSDDPNEPIPNLSALPSPTHAGEIVKLSADFSLKCTVPHNDHYLYNPPPIKADRFALSALGAQTRLLAKFAPQDLDADHLDVDRWEHHTEWGRDQFVLVSRAGCLYPFGHRASLVQTRERLFNPVSKDDGEEGTAAYLRERWHIELKEPFREFSFPDDVYTDDRRGRSFCFKSVSIEPTSSAYLRPPVDLIDPDYEPPESDEPCSSGNVRAFWPLESTSGLRYKFVVTAVDRDGTECQFEMPFVWVSIELSERNGLGGLALLKMVHGIYEKDLPGSVVPIGCPALNLVPFVEPTRAGESKRSTPLETDCIHFTTDIYDDDGNANEQRELMDLVRRYQPRVKSAFVLIPQVAQFTASVSAGVQSTKKMRASKLRFAQIEEMGFDTALASRLASLSQVAYNNRYDLNGFDEDNNLPEIFADILNADFEYPSKNGGGAIAPSISLTNLSRKFGPVGGGDSDGSGRPGDALDESLNRNDNPLFAGKFDPTRYFAGADTAKLVGDIRLADVMKAVTGKERVTAAVRPYVPNFVSQKPPTVPGSAEGISHGVSFKWSPEVERRPKILDGLFYGFIKTDEGTQFSDMSVNVSITRAWEESEPDITVDATLTNFTLNLFGDTPGTKYIILRFQRLDFQSVNGGKPDVDVLFHSFGLSGPPGFFAKLAEAFALPDGFQWIISPSLSGIYLGLRYTVPPFSVGAFNITQLSFGLAVGLSFRGEPIIVRFQISERHKPFLVNVGILGGGGFLALYIQSNRLIRVEVVIEFGALVQLYLGPANGQAYILGGIYLSKSGDAMILVGYVRAGGVLSVLGLITISVEFYLGLAYVKIGDTSYLEGEASITVEVEVLFFSVSVRLTVRRRFAGSDQETEAIQKARMAMGLGTSKVPEPDIDPPCFPVTHEHQVAWHAYRAAFAW